jgi:DNA-binding MarR family transcriptional regulator
VNAIYGEIEAAGIPTESAQAQSPSLGQQAVDPRLHSLDKWDGVKKRLGGKEAELIDVLLTSGPRTNTQLKSLLKIAYSTVAALTLRMTNMGFIKKNGDAYALKD